MRRANYVYRYRDKIYINLTNRCPTACVFCIKVPWRMEYRGADLRLAQEPTPRQVMRAMARYPRFRETVFCGYGEATYRLDALTKISDALHRRGFSKIRLNTIGLGNLINGRDIVAQLAGRLRSVSVSLNTADPRRWLALHRPQPQWRAGGFDSVLSFIGGCVGAGLKTTVTAVDGLGEDIGEVRNLAKKLGASFRLRPSLPAGD